MTNFFADLESDLGPVADDSTPVRAGYFADSLKFAQSGNQSRFVVAKKTTRPSVTCPKCRGNGRVTYGFVNIQSGECFKCHGTGMVLGVKLDDASVKARQQAAVRRDSKKAEAEAVKAAWAVEHADVLDWIARNPRFEFAVSLGESYARFGSLTEGQLIAVQKCIQRDVERAEARKAERATTAAPAQGLDLSAVPAGRYAVPEGETRLKVLIKKPRDGKWAGFIFVSDAAEYGQQTRYGMQSPGGAYRGKIVEALTAIAADPKAAAIAYGSLTGTCSCCGRTLEDAESIAAGIGPICAKKHGW